MTINTLIDFLGWLGAAALLVAYGMVSSKRLAGDSATYQMLNAAGSGLLIVNSFYYGAFPSVGVNAIWVGIGIFTLARMRFKVKNNP